MEPSGAASPPDRAIAAAASLQKVYRKRRGHSKKTHVRTPLPSSARLAASLSETPYDLCEYSEQAESKRGTVLYLAYGSNLCNETFRGKRGIRPLSQVNVQVPSLRLTFDLPGIPYVEPCFANSGARDPNDDPPRQDVARQINNEKTPLLGDGACNKEGYRKDQWHKGLIGVVYEVTAQDYAHIIATEGGGSAYHDILVDCHPFVSSDPGVPVPQNPTLPAFKAHTLFAPAAPAGEDPPKDGGRFQRPDVSYAQASARYLKLITDGAAELDLPYEYQDYLHAMRPYTVTTNKQRIGQFVFVAIWMPVIAFIFLMGGMFQDDQGRHPRWMREFSGAVFKAVWASYDSYFKPMFGDGERSITDGGDDVGDEEAARNAGKRMRRSLGSSPYDVDLEKAAT
ncbi:hypothetical protein LTR36_007071 [Oleoguttula mirabilis]|uniref:gamma-glutamylcyclotransferase n=1 Tax=Oleoguttula mirabilis TaxID=1507867 RepID=A0AAV9JAW3_9PEZI|nr:hypothetical protein LTR36_007071 [Oleoguttula mirabilis]